MFSPTALPNSSFALQFSARLDSTMHDFPTGTCGLIKGRTFILLFSD